MPRTGKRPPEILTAEEVSALLRLCSLRAPTGVRNRALITVMYRGGLRVAEALALRLADVDTRAGTVRIGHGKGDKSRVVSLDDGAMAVVERWIARRAALELPRYAPVTKHMPRYIREAAEALSKAPRVVPPLFCSLDGGYLAPQYVRAMLARKAEAAGIEKHVRPHGLRHSNASELAAESVPVNVISKHLGHANVGVTARYLDHVAPADVLAMGRGREWSEE